MLTRKFGSSGLSLGGRSATGKLLLAGACRSGHWQSRATLGQVYYSAEVQEPHHDGDHEGQEKRDAGSLT
jgi:hypothetical protein